MKEMISNIYMSVIEEIDKLEAEDDAFAESKIKQKDKPSTLNYYKGGINYGKLYKLIQI